MKKIVFALLFATAFINPSLKGMDTFCIKNHESALLKDQNWHTLKFESTLNNDVENDDNFHVASILIRQTNITGDYEFKSNTKDEVLEFYDWLTFKAGIGKISIEKTSDGYVGAFYNSTFVPEIDDLDSFIGIDV